MCLLRWRQPTLATGDPDVGGMAEQFVLALLFSPEPPRHALRPDVLAVDAVDDMIQLEGGESPIDRRARRLDRVALVLGLLGHPQPISKCGQPGGNHGPTRPTKLPVDFSSTANMPAPYS